MEDTRTSVNWKPGRLLSDAFFVALFCLASACALLDVSAAPTGRERYTLLGTIENVDSGANTITVRLSDGTDKILQVGKRLMVNGREEMRSRTEATVKVPERAVVYYTDTGGDETAVEVESLNHAMHRTVTGTLISADKDNKTVVLRTARGKNQTFRVRNDAVIETGDSVLTFAQFEPQAGAQIILHYEDPFGMVEVTRIKR